MEKLTQAELNGLSPRARKVYLDNNGVLSEVLTENPRSIEIEVIEDKPKQKKEYKDEKL
jgi:hypothetical protein|tara:strand:+ start:822 stop:998 length:177 start_codon:yes stop_codon:yes gene_type:complete